MDHPTTAPGCTRACHPAGRAADGLNAMGSLSIQLTIKRHMRLLVEEEPHAEVALALER